MNRLLGWSRSAALVAAVLIPATTGVLAQGVTVHRAAGAMTVRAPGFTFIKGEPLAWLKDGRSVRVELELSVLSGPGIIVTRSQHAFALSYDLWEERFAVTQLSQPSGAPGRSAAYLTATAAESWCVERVTVPLSTMGAHAADVPFWVRLEYRIPDGGAQAEPDNGSGYTLQSLIDALSRRRTAQARTHAVMAGPFRLTP